MVTLTIIPISSDAPSFLLPFTASPPCCNLSAASWGLTLQRLVQYLPVLSRPKIISWLSCHFSHNPHSRGQDFSNSNLDPAVFSSAEIPNFSSQSSILRYMSLRIPSSTSYSTPMEPRSLYCSTSLLVSTWSISSLLCIAYSIIHCFNLSLLTKDLQSVFQLPTWWNFYTGHMLWFLFFQIISGLWDRLLLQDGAHWWLTCGHQPQLVTLFHPSLSHTF